MAIDTSIALNAGNQPNILQTLMGATQLKGQIAQQQANVAASAAYKQATDPTTGQVDYGKLSAALSQGPAAYNLPQIQAQVNEARNSSLQYDTNKVALAQKRTDLLSNGFGGLLASGNVTPQAVMTLASQGIKQGLFSPEDAVNFTSDMPSDPSQLTSWAKQKYIGFSADSNKLAALLPKQQTINTGAQQIITNTDPISGANTGTNTIFNNQLSPEAASTPTQIFDPTTGTMRTVTRDQFANMATNQAAPQQGAAQSAPGDLGSGRMAAPQPGMVPAQPSAPGLQAAPALGATEAASVVARGAAEQSVGLANQANAAPQSIYQFQNMRQALQTTPTGPGTDWRQQAKSFVTALSPDVAAKMGIDPQQVASADEFKKYATQAVQATLGNLGEGTDAKLASAYSANPGPGLSNLANDQLIGTLIAGQRAIVAKNNAWQNSGLPPEQFNKFSTQWNNSVDPRIFTLQDLPRDKAIAMRNSLKPSEQKAFDASYNSGVQSGIIQRIGQ